MSSKQVSESRALPSLCVNSAATVGGACNLALVQADSTSEFSINNHLEMIMMPKIGALKRT